MNTPAFRVILAGFVFAIFFAAPARADEAKKPTSVFDLLAKTLPEALQNGVELPPFKVKAAESREMTELFVNEFGNKVKFYKVKPQGESCPLGDFAVTFESIEAGKTKVLLLSATGDALAHPVKFERYTDSAGTGNKRSVAYYEMVPPEGYEAMGICFTDGKSEPVKEDYWCVNKKYVMPAALKEYWNPAGAGFKEHDARLIKPALKSDAPEAASNEFFIVPTTLFSGEHDGPAFVIRSGAPKVEVAIATPTPSPVPTPTPTPAPTPTPTPAADDSAVPKTDYPGTNDIGLGVDPLAESNASEKGRLIVAQDDPAFRLPRMYSNPDYKDSIFTSRDYQSLKTQMKIETDVKAEIGTYSAELQTSWEKTQTQTEEKFIGYRSVGCIKSIMYYRPETVKPLLRPDVLKDLNDEAISPAAIFEKYGTHIVAQIYLGGRVESSYESNKASFESEEKFKAALKASCRVASGSINFEMSKEEKQEREKLTINTWVKGGENATDLSGKDIAPAALTAWAASIKDHPVCVGRPKGSLVPIWSFCEKPDRQNKINLAFEMKEAKYSIEHPVLFSAVFKDQQDNAYKDRQLDLKYTHPHYKIISGGARITTNGQGYGMALSESYPQNDTDWHATGDASPQADSTAEFAIRVLAIYDPNNHFQVEIVPNTISVHLNSPSNIFHPNGTVSPAEAAVPPDKDPRGSWSVLTGCGGKAQADTRGFYLAGFKADPIKGMSAYAGPWGHTRDKYGHISDYKLGAYAIYLRPRSKGAKALNVQSKIFTDSDLKGHHPTKAVSVGSDWILVGGGASMDEGQFLVASVPDGGQWYGESKDIVWSGEGTIQTFAIGLKVPEE